MVRQWRLTRTTWGRHAVAQTLDEAVLDVPGGLNKMLPTPFTDRPACDQLRLRVHAALWTS
eukprot:10342975-Karenia_brevis.AAC.1